MSVVSVPERIDTTDVNGLKDTSGNVFIWLENIFYQLFTEQSNGTKGMSGVCRLMVQ